MKLSNFKKMFAQKYGITKLGIFGSVARNENTENSDIDIVVEVQKPTLQLMYELKEALKQLFGCEVDLVRFRDSLRPSFKSNIQRDVIYVWLPKLEKRTKRLIFAISMKQIEVVAAIIRKGEWLPADVKVIEELMNEIW